MPKFHPTPIIQDCWSSIGNITFYHRNGQCFYKRKPYTQYRGTAAQLDQAQVHHRAILAWQQLTHSVQLQWRELAKSVPSHRPPYDDNHHISGYNLFVSAYHGFAQLGREHVPVPQPYPLFPISHLQLLQIDSAGTSGSVSLRCRLTLQNTDNPARWHVSAKIQLTAPGVGCDPGKMRSCMATHLSDTEIAFTVPNLGLEDYKVHIRYRLIDEVTGYRNNWNKAKTG
ncbi:MAG: hypothetical protein J6W18_01685 [Bacteroidaceae bacterium]|nr:hypothetical protein [Bacteroidaceae bacterium]